MTRSAFTIHGFFYDKRLGFESTHIARQEVFDNLQIDHKIIFSDPFIKAPNWQEKVEEKKGVKYTNVLLEKSSIALDKPSLSKEEALALIGNPTEIKKINYSKDNFVSSIELDQETIHFTSDILMVNRHEYTTLFDKNSEIVANIKKEDSYWVARFIDGTRKNNWDLIVEWLAENSKTDDIFITDFSNQHPLVLKKFFQNTGRTLHSVIHYNILSPIMRFSLSRWCKLLVASEVLEEKLKLLEINSQFLAPIFTKKAEKKEYKGVKNYCLVGSRFPVKRMELAIEAFRKLEDTDLRLTIYGGLTEELEEKDLPPNVSYAGYVKEVPYHKHEGYISCSSSECFANAMVEATENGLVCLVSDVDLAHRYYKSLAPNSVTLFQEQDDLVKALLELKEKELISPYQIAEKYKFEKLKESYKKIFEI